MNLEIQFFVDIFKNPVLGLLENFFLCMIQMVALTIILTTATDPTTNNTKEEMLIPELGWLSSGPGSAWGISKATCAMLDNFDLELLLSTLWMAINMWVVFSSEIFPGLNAKVSLELASFGNRSVVFTWRALSKLSLRSRILPLIFMIHCSAKKKKLGIA